MNTISNITAALALFALATNAQAIELINEGNTKLSFGGYIKAEGVFFSPVEGDSDFEGSVRESRINLKTTTVVDDKKVTGFIEGDFYGDLVGKGADLRLRHAYLQVDNLTVGKTWNGQFFAVAPQLTEQLDFWSTGFGTIVGSGINARPDLSLHYVNKGLRFTAQDPAYGDANMPDMVVSYTGKLSDIDYTLAITGREANTAIGNESDSDIGLGISLAGKLPIGNGSLHGSVYNGKGMGVYSGVCATGALSPVTKSCDSESGKLISQTGFSVGYRHNFTPKLRGNMRYGKVTVDNELDTSINMKSVNLIYKYLPDLELGIEWRDRSETTLPWREKGQDVEVMAKYSF